MDWLQKGSPYWVRFIHIELVGYPSGLPPPAPIKVGDKVRVRGGVGVPRYKWGSVDHSSVGVVSSISSNGRELRVDFPQQPNWSGVISEMEVLIFKLRPLTEGLIFVF